MAAEAQTAFISYSREDSEFTLRLANDLKAAGAAVWLDQLDIAPGERWAKAVEDALNNCPHMLVILSPSSASSTNVDDEVSFALEEKKTVIPVIYRDCRIPFRLRPFQYVDFRGEYDLGLKRLLKTRPAAPQGAGPAAPKQVKWIKKLFKTPPAPSALNTGLLHRWKSRLLFRANSRLSRWRSWSKRNSGFRRRPRQRRNNSLLSRNRSRARFLKKASAAALQNREQTEAEDKPALQKEHTEELRETPSEAEIQSVISDEVDSVLSVPVVPQEPET